jgi:hypothetical protein
MRIAAVVVLLAAAALTDAPSADAADFSGPPRVSVGGGSVVEGHLQRRYVRFTVTLSWRTNVPVTVQYATGDPSDTASPPGDYRAKSGTLTFKAGQKNKLVSVLVWPDGQDEGDETFTLKLFNPTNGTLGYATATGTIIDDDPYVGNRVSIGDATVAETCEGPRNPAAVVVTLAAPTGAPETVTVSTAPATPATAVAGVDYVAINKTVTFKVGVNLKEIRIPVNPDLAVEGTESFLVNLTLGSGPVPVLRAQGAVTILDCIPPPD